MDELGKLFKLVADNNVEEAKKLTDAIRAKTDKLDSEMNSQEAKKLEAIKTRDEMKSRLKKVASELGVGEIEDVSDAIEAIKNKKSGGDKSKEFEIKDKEIEQLKGEVQTASQALKDAKSMHQTQILGVALEKDIATTLPKYKAKANAMAYIIDAVKKQAVYEEGKVVFKNADGTTLRANGSDATLDDVIKSMQVKEKEANESMFFDIGVQQSGAGANQGGKTAEGDFVP